MALLVVATVCLAAALAAADEVCSVESGVDVCISMDASGSITGQGFEQEKAFALQLMTSFQESTTRVSVFSFSTFAVQVASLNQSFSETQTAVNEFEQNIGGTDIVYALEACAEDLQTDLPNRQKLIVLMTDGEGFGAEGQIAAADEVKNANMTLATIGIELDVVGGFSEETLTEMASEKHNGSGKLFYSFSIDLLPEESVSREIATEVCANVEGEVNRGGISIFGKIAISVCTITALVGAGILVWKFAFGGAMPSFFSSAADITPVGDMEAAVGSDDISPPPPPPPSSAPPSEMPPSGASPSGVPREFRTPLSHQSEQPGSGAEGPGSEPGPLPKAPVKNPSAQKGPGKTEIEVLKKLPAMVISISQPAGSATGPSPPSAEGGLEDLGAPGVDGCPIHLSIALDTSRAGCYDEPGTGYKVRNTYAEAIGKLLMTLAVPAKGSVEISFVSVSGDEAAIPLLERKSRIISDLDDAKEVIKHVEPPHGANLSRATASGLIRSTKLCSQLLDETDKCKRIIKRTLIVSPGGCPDEEMTSARRTFGPQDAQGSDAGDPARWKTSPGIVLCTLGNTVDRGAAVQLGHVAVLCRDIEHFSAGDVLKLIGGLIQAQDPRQRARL